MNRKLVTTADGSHSIFIAELDENYHSVHGAIQESQHVFIDAGWKAVCKARSKHKNTSPINIFEMGLGTGLNAFMTYLAWLPLTTVEVEPLIIPVHYTAIEAYPVTLEMMQQLNYVEQLSNYSASNYANIFTQIHTSLWNKKIPLSPNFDFTKLQANLATVDLPDNYYHLIYFDAFAPSAQAHLWTEAIFAKLYAAMQTGGLLTTYCAKGVVKRTLKKVGFEIEALPGPPGKREMTRAWKR